LVVLVGLAIDQIAQSGLSSLSVIYYSAQLFSLSITSARLIPWLILANFSPVTQAVSTSVTKHRVTTLMNISESFE
ncbi:hypothetical protein, partial [Klebsiella pneumoniae]